MFSERVILATSDGEDEEENDLYKGYNDFNPALDTRNIQEDELFKETVKSSSYGRTGRQRTNLSTAGVAFNRATALRSRRTSRGTGGPGPGGTGATAAAVAAAAAAGTRPLTAVRGAGYTSHGTGTAGGTVGTFDPLGLAAAAATGGGGGQKGTGFHLQDENTPEHKIKQLEAQINRLLEESVNAATSDRKDFSLALDLAKDCVTKERSLNRMKEQSGLMEQFGQNSDLTFAAIFNLAERYSDAQMWTEAIDTYQSILKNRTFTNTGRLRMNIGEIYFKQGQFPKAIKFFRMALDQIANTQTELRLKLMQNIGLSFVRLTHFADAIASFEYIASERGDLDAQTAFHLIVCYYAMGDNDKMKYYFGKLLQCKVEDQFEERYGYHEILTNGGNIFAVGGGGGGGGGGVGGGGGGGSRATLHSPMIGDEIRNSTPSGEISSGRASSPVLLIRDEHDHRNNLLVEAIRNDRLRQFEKQKIQHVEWCVLTAAKLIAPYIEQQQPIDSSIGGNSNSKIMNNNNLIVNGEPQNETIGAMADHRSIGAGYDWCLEQIRRMSHSALMTNGFGGSGSANGTSHDHNQLNGLGASGNNSGSNSSSGMTYALNYSNLADELELYKAVKHLRSRQFEQAISTFKTFEKKDKLNSAIALSASSPSSARQSHENAHGLAGASSSSSGSATGSGLTGPNLAIPILNNAIASKIGNSTITGAGNSRVAATAATNLSFLYLLQGELEIAARYADEAIAADRYCIGALLNRGNVYYHFGEYRRAIEHYREVISTNANCLEACYNVALAEKRLGNYEGALEALFRVRAITKISANTANRSILNRKISNTVEVNLLFQIGSIYELMGNLDQATDFYQQVLNIVPTDASLLVKLSDIATDTNDRKQALAYLMEAYRYLPSHIPTIERLAAYYIEMKMYERAIKYLEQLSNIQPNQIKWQLMIAASYRRAGNYQQAFSMYQTIHGRFPDNTDCLKILIRICSELDAEGRGGGGGGAGSGNTNSNSSNNGGTRSYAQLADQYSDKLKRLEKNRELREQQQQQLMQSNSRSASRASTSAARPGTQQSNNNARQSGSSREGSASVTSASSGASSSGYITSSNNNRNSKTGNKSSSLTAMMMMGNDSSSSGGRNIRSDEPITSGRLNRAAISAIVDEVVEQLDSTALNERPTTSWGRSTYNRNKNHDDPANSANNVIDNRNTDYDDDLLLDANLDEILPD